MEVFLLVPLALFIIALFIPVLRKTLGVLFIILGGITSLTLIGALVGIPMIIGGGILLFIGSGSDQQINIVNNLPETKVDDERIECPYCAEMIKPNAKICRYCQKELPIKIVTQKKVICPYCQSEFEDKSEICPNCKKVVYECDVCGTTIKEEDKKCFHCGAEFDQI